MKEAWSLRNKVNSHYDVLSQILIVIVFFLYKSVLLTA
jgi:hypothetical protein